MQILQFLEQTVSFIQNKKGIPLDSFTFKRIILAAQQRTDYKRRKEEESLIRKVFQKSRLVIMVALPSLVEVEVVISSRIPGTFERQSQQDLLSDGILGLKKRSIVDDIQVFGCDTQMNLALLSQKGNSGIRAGFSGVLLRNKSLKYLSRES